MVLGSFTLPPTPLILNIPIVTYSVFGICNIRGAGFFKLEGGDRSLSPLTLQVRFRVSTAMKDALYEQ